MSPVDGHNHVGYMRDNVMGCDVYVFQHDNPFNVGIGRAFVDMFMDVRKNCWDVILTTSTWHAISRRSAPEHRLLQNRQ